MDALNRLLLLYPVRTTIAPQNHTGANRDAELAKSTTSIAFHVVAGGGSSAEADTLLLSGQFMFDDGAGNALLDALPDELVVRGDGLLPFIALIKQECGAPQARAAIVQTQLASALFPLLMRAWLEQVPAQPGLFGLLAERRLQPALQGMLDAPARTWSLVEMATACHMSRATFARLFHQVAGTTPATVLLQTRMALAAIWLAQSAHPVRAIGVMVGYRSEAAFSRAFKRNYGVGPGAYRRDSKARAAPLLRAPDAAASAHASRLEYRDCEH